VKIFLVFLVDFLASLDCDIDGFGTDFPHFAGEKNYKEGKHDLLGVGWWV
jgi:hypothetical protein